MYIILEGHEADCVVSYYFGQISLKSNQDNHILWHQLTLSVLHESVVDKSEYDLFYIV